MQQDFLEKLNPAQRKAVTHTDGPLLIVAGAGTGKTTVLTKRYAYLLAEQNLTTEHILAVTFTEKAAQEMEDRVLEELPIGAYDFWIDTFHGFCQRILQAHALDIGLPNQFRVLTETDAWILLRRHLHELPLDYYRPLGNPTKFLQALIQHISRAKDEAILPEQYLAFARDLVLNQDAEDPEGERKRVQELADLYHFYRKLLLDNGLLDFGDLILETLRLFRERPLILKKYQEQFRHILVDEFQDTNSAQYDLLKLLASGHRNITVVGDDDQAIYMFRGASLANILQFKDDYPDAATVALTDNYRSHHEILDRAYFFIRKNDPHRLEVKLQDQGLSKKLTAFRGIGGEVKVLWRGTVEEEAEAVVEDMVRRREEDASLEWNDFAILVRAHDHAEPFVAACERAGVPYQFLAQSGLYVKMPVLDAFAVLSLMDGRHESATVWRVLRLPCYGMSDADMAELSAHCDQRHGIHLWRAVQDAANGVATVHVSDEGRAIARRLVDDVAIISSRVRRESAFKVLYHALDQTKYLAFIMKLPEEERAEAIMHLNGFAARVRRYEASSQDPSLHGFLEEFRQELESGEDGALAVDPEAGPEFVKIMTIHKAKGLEFKHVYVVSMVDQRFPSRERSQGIELPPGLAVVRLVESGDEHLEEERRLFYVAITRAKDSLTLTGALSYGGTRAKKPSVFLTEAGLDLTCVGQPSVTEKSLASLMSQGMGEDMRTRLSARHPVAQHFTRKSTFSYTQLAAFRNCPLQYKLAHVYRIPILGSYQKSFGESVHATFQRVLHEQKERVSLAQGSLFTSTTTTAPSAGLRVTEEEALVWFEEYWSDEWYPDDQTRDAYRENGKQAVRKFIRAYAHQAPDVLEVEKELTLPFGQHRFKVKIDRMDRLPDGSVAVIDYKTGKAKHTEDLKAEDKAQLRIYQIALEQAGIKVGRLSNIYVIDWVVADVEPLEGKKREEFIVDLETTMDEIVTSSYPPKPSEQTCKNCDFRNFCEFRK
ncbi:MAG: ATP-dependent DNA helicase [Patescibacteria group bacterium]